MKKWTCLLMVLGISCFMIGCTAETKVVPDDSTPPSGDMGGPTDTPGDMPTDTPGDAPTDTPGDAPAQPSTDAPPADSGASTDLDVDLDLSVDKAGTPPAGDAPVAKTPSDS